jgi:hypothetical protein
MYACIPETRCGFFEGACAPGKATAYSRDPPPPLHSPTALSKPCSYSDTEVYVRAFCFVVSHQQSGLCGLGKEIFRRMTMWHMNHVHVADVSTPAAL